MPLIYNCNISIFNKVCDDIISEFPLYTNFISNYFKAYKLNYILKGDYDYNKIPDDCKGISFLENYNKYRIFQNKF